MDEDHDMKIVSGLKDPWKFLFVDMDVAMLAVLVGFVLLSVGLSTPMVLAAAAGLGYTLHALRKGKPRGYARHLAYWHLPPAVGGLRRVPPAWAHTTVG